jgi:hypothetical protein
MRILQYSRLNFKKGGRAMTYRKFTWVGSQISDEDMARLYRLKQTVRIPITKLIARAVKEFLERQTLEGGEK